MNAQIPTTLAAAAVGAAALLLCGTVQAATVGYNGGCYGDNSGTGAAIAAAGHTPIAIANLDAPTLAALDALMFETCGGSPYSPAVIEAAVTDGLTLIVHDWYSSFPLPGAAGLSRVTGYAGAYDMLLPGGSPLLQGPGGTLAAGSPIESFPQGYATLASLPAGSTVLVTKSTADQVVAFTYSFGRGHVVNSTVPLSCFLAGGGCTSSGGAPAVRAYAGNLIDWAAGLRFISCADEGFTSSKLTLCRQVCEIDQTPTRLTSLIRLYMSAYRSEPPCGR